MNEQRPNFVKRAHQFGRKCRQTIDEFRASHYGERLERVMRRGGLKAVHSVRRAGTVARGLGRAVRILGLAVGWLGQQLIRGGRFVARSVSQIVKAVYGRLTSVRRETWAIMSACCVVVMCSGTRSSQYRYVPVEPTRHPPNHQFPSLNSAYHPSGLAIDADGNRYVASRFNSGVHVFNKTGQFVRSFGGSQDRGGLLSRPRQIVIGSDGQMFVTTSGGRDRIHVFDKHGVFLRRFGSEQDVRSPSAIALTTAGDTIVSDSYRHRVVGFDAAGKLKFTIGKYGRSPGLFHQPTGVAVDRDGRIVVADSANSRVQVFSQAGEYIFGFGTRGSGEGQLQSPQGVATDHDNNILVADTQNRRVQVFNASGGYLRSFGRRPQDGNRFHRPTDISVDEFGNVAVTDSGNHSVQVFDGEGTFRYAFGQRGRGRGEIWDPSGVAFGSDKTLVVVDSGNNRLQVFDRLRNPIKVIGSKNGAKGVLQNPNGIAISPTGDVVVVDTDNDRVQVFGKTGVFLHSYGRHGMGEGEFDRPTDVVVDSSGLVYVTDSMNRRIQVFDNEGTYQSKFGRNLREPLGISMTSDGRILVTDRYLSDIYVYKDQKLAQTIRTSLHPLKKAVQVADGRIFAISTGESGVFALDSNGQVIDHFGGYSQLFAGPFGVAKGIGSWMSGKNHSVVHHASDLEVSTNGTIIVGDWRCHGVKTFRRAD